MGLMLVALPTQARQTLDTPDAVAVVAAPDRERTRMNARVFDRVWSETRSQYYDPNLHGVDWGAARRTYRPEALAAADDRTLYRVMSRMLALLDDAHAGVISPAAARRQDGLRQPRAALGVTLRADPEDGSYLIEKVRPGSPAAEAGLDVGWRLLIDERSEWSPDRDVVEGQTLRLNLRDAAGQSRAVTVMPRILPPLAPFVADRSREGVLLLRIEGFEAGLGQWMGGQLADLEPATEVVIDLRGNPGGRLHEADAVLSCFLPVNRTWATRTVRSGRRVPLRTMGGCGDRQMPADNPVAILVDAESRSAAELTPAALQEAGRAVVVGEQTAGAVLISQETRLPDGGRLTLSRADFVTSGGVRLEKRGVRPDILAARSAEDSRAGRDPVLEAALAALRTAHDAATVSTAEVLAL